MITTHLKWMALNALFPLQCLGCNRYDTPLCVECIQSHLDIEVLSGKDSDTLQSITTLGAYHEPFWRQAIAQLKFYGVQEMATPLGTALAAVLDITNSSTPPLCIPIPLHPLREKERGFNQSALLAELVASLHELSLDSITLRRTVHTTSQTQVAHEDRTQNIADAFTVEPQAATKLHKRAVVLIDDVITTGATIQEAAKILRGTGVLQVHALAIARGE